MMPLCNFLIWLPKNYRLFIYCYNVIIQEIKKVTKWHHFEVAIDITFDNTAVLVLNDHLEQLWLR